MALPLRLLIIASARDQESVSEFLSHLSLAERQKKIVVDAEERIMPGTEINAWYDTAIAEDEAALLFLSSDFFNDDRIVDYILPKILERVASGMKLFLLPLRPSMWDQHPGLANRQTLLAAGQFLSLLPPEQREKVAMEIVRKLIGAEGSAPAPGSDQERTGSSHRKPTDVTAESPSPSPSAAPRPPHWGYFAALSAMFVGLVGLTVFFGPQLRSQQALLTVTVLFAISLLAALLLAGVLRSTGRLLFSDKGYVTGAAAICLITFVILCKAFLSLSPTSQEWLARGHVEGLPPGQPAWLGAPGCGEVAINRQNDRFELPMHDPCDQSQINFIVRVAQHEGTQSFPTPRTTAQQDFTLTWKPLTQEVTSFSGTLLDPDRHAAAHVRVRLAADCPEAASLAFTESGADGRFLIPNIPPGCRQKPYQIEVTLPDGRVVPLPLRKPWNDFVDLPPALPPAPGVAPVRGATSVPTPNKTASLRLPGGFYDTVRVGANQLNLVHLPAGHGLERGRWLGLFRRTGGERELVGYGSVVDASDQSAKFYQFYLEGQSSKTGLLAGPLPVQPKIGKALGSVLQTLGDKQVRINLGNGDGVQAGDSYRVLGAAVGDAVPSGRSLGREKIGTLRVEQVETLFSTASITDGYAPPNAYIMLQKSPAGP